MITDTKNRILQYIAQKGQTRVVDLVRYLGYSPVAIHKQLRNLVKNGTVNKIGRPPKVYYVIRIPVQRNLPIISPAARKIINQKYLYISPQGEILSGVRGFAAWAENIAETKNLTSLINSYIKFITETDKFRTGFYLIDALSKIKTTFKECFLDGIYYFDFYSLPQFGKTKLGQLVLHAKQTQNRQLMMRIVEETKPSILKLIGKYKIEAVGFIPPSLPRQIQFIKELEKMLSLPIPKIDLNKVTGEVVVAQKTLARLEERIVNARSSIALESNPKYNTILLIDDAVGSGASFNETARKIKEAGIAKKVFGFAIVGSYKGFDVIREV